MIEYVVGDLLRAPAEALVNTVNCVGTMGKGLAFQFKQAYPAMFDEYASLAVNGKILPGRMHVFATGVNQPHHKWIINFPTKRHWRDPSKLEYVDDGLTDLVRQVKKHQIASIAVPALGCGLGALPWRVISPRIESTFDALPDVRVFLYEPQLFSNRL